MIGEDELRRRYATRRSEAAFDELVRRHMDFVYSVCRRKLGDGEMARDVTQTVFLLLAQKSGSMRPGTVLTGWLFQAAHLACRNALRAEARRRHYEGKAAREMDDAARGLDTQWRAVETDWDDALAQLAAADRNAIFLRYIEEMSIEETATALGVSVAAAQKRVMRAVERLRRHFGRSGAALSAGAVTAILTQKMVEAAPAAHAAAILQATTGPSAAITDTLPFGLSGHGYHLWRQVTLTKAQIFAAGALVAAAFAGGLALRHHATAVAAQTPVKAAVPAQIIAVRGRVLDPAGKPDPGARVTLLRYGITNGATAEEVARTVTDNAGRYAIPQVAGGPLGLAVVADDGKAMEFGTPDMDLQLSPPTRMLLHVVDANQQPAVGVRLKPIMFSITGPRGETATINLAVGSPDRLTKTTDAQGNAIFTGLPQGFTVSFQVLSTEYARRPPAADGIPLSRTSDSGSFLVDLAPSAVLEGRVVYGDTGKPAAQIRVGAQEIGSAAWGEAVTDADGRYSVTQLLPGNYNVAVDEQSPALAGEWTAAARANVVVESGASIPSLDMRLSHGTMIVGTVRSRTGALRAPVTIGVYGPAHPRGGAWVNSVDTGRDGTYRLRVPPGRQYVYPLNNPAGGVDVTVSANHDTQVNFEQ
ncbi:MAG: polymerase sigma factor, sigma-70 family [Capsulimonas sp.]|nr:polymerase sigma factor, sigma-70 family [Capsulimonas sp.]